MEAKWGLVPDMTGTVTLRELVPMDVAKRLTMTAEVIDGGTLAYGLVTEVADDPHAAAAALRAQLLLAPPTRSRSVSGCCTRPGPGRRGGRSGPSRCCRPG